MWTGLINRNFYKLIPRIRTTFINEMRLTSPLEFLSITLIFHFRMD